MAATPAVPGIASPGLMRPGDPVTSGGGPVAASSRPTVSRTGTVAAVASVFSAVPGRAQPGLFTPGNPVASYGTAPAIGTATVSAACVSTAAVSSG